MVRTDNIGDVLLTTPAVAAIKRRYPKSFIGYLCTSYTAPLLENNPAINKIYKMDGSSSADVIKQLREGKFNASIHYYVDTKSMVLVRSAGISKRIGPLSKLWSFLLTDKITQDRSNVEKHEAEYNLDLARECGSDGAPIPPVLSLRGIEKREASQILSQACGKDKVVPVVMHPGTKGHVESWPVEFFIDLAHKIGERGDNVVFTAGPGEGKIIEQVKKRPHPNIHALPPGSLSLRQLAALIAISRIFIGNSSGPLHIATAVGVPTISFFPKEPIVTSAKRWGPFGNYKLNRVISPLHARDSLSSISIDTVMEWVINVFQSNLKVDPESDYMIG